MKHRKRVYLETTIPSYLTANRSRDLVVAGHQQVTMDRWEDRRSHFSLFISQFVIDEVSLGNKDMATKRQVIVKGITELKITEAVQELAAGLVAGRAIPRNAAQDAAHIAVAAVHGMDYLLTWNCAHIANAEIIPSVRKICEVNGYECPHICTPEELMGV